MAGNTPDTHNEIAPSAPKPVLTVTQPATISSLLDTLNLIDQMSERIGEDHSGDMGAPGAGLQARAGATGASGQSPRDVAIQNLPPQKAMQEKLEEKIRAEVGSLRRQIRSIPSAHKPGAAFKLNKLYARIRLLNRLLGNLLEASVDIVKRLFIRVFIDEQPIL
ncbi:MAG TPA: hypothetical protein DEB30_03230 [Candidatus Peribacter riflensis]|uniref:Uncharacterized protein n=1 Tax=Candidatus Peribacter riflensis TaxID=1735162 RepID=A0A0S1SKF9_9BACT|nr:MAG: hypothetical protein PeribacterA2_0659 [Candidatus Peribacter riflensis]OGJ78349.1 MAG: hypothetical protein A2412_00295 [Candidatus Peribacteria bacterium RIFOXYC1_FULL_58_8]OGJ78984.1 MAG: hypothetical protein A2398_04765 [Candidatus Peribacteria bacterium RIFOXYB1_FULL_57_12]ALM11129.1 MAG: hypothetical protein PeribacterB2_0659 [Candidatus Peribacter riflensis]ALM12232.1 MAG: hypothetical protein PeribacterC2_0659 [Candidatus Peribacter riflensis]